MARDVDPASFELAEHFLPRKDLPDWWADAVVADWRMSLARDIQEAVEDWFLSKENLSA